MKMPGFNAEAAAYKGTHYCYFGWMRGDACGSQVLAAAGCDAGCAAGCYAWQVACEADYAVLTDAIGNLAGILSNELGGFGLDPCQDFAKQCLANCGCSDGGGGGGGGIGGWANPCCPPGERCCGHCGTTVVNNRHFPFCYGTCVGRNEACPKQP